MKWLYLINSLIRRASLSSVKGEVQYDPKNIWRPSVEKYIFLANNKISTYQYVLIVLQLHNERR